MEFAVKSESSRSAIRPNYPKQRRDVGHMELSQRIDPKGSTAAGCADEFTIHDLKPSRRPGECLVSLVEITIHPGDWYPSGRIESAELFAQSFQSDCFGSCMHRIDFIQ